MDTPGPALEVLKDRLRAYLAFLKQKMLAAGDDLDRLSQLRRLNDVRIQQFAVGKPQLTVGDLAGLVLDPKSGPFDQAAVAAGLLRPGHIAIPLPAMGEETGFVIEACLTHQLVGAPRSAGYLKEFVALKGAAQDLSRSEARAIPAAPAIAPLPLAVARLLPEAHELWTLPASARNVLKLLESAGTPADAVAREIEKDAALGPLFLKIVNAAYSWSGGRTASIKLAVVKFGYPVIRRLVQAATLIARLARQSEGFDLKDFWSHGLRTAHASFLLARITRTGQPDECFFAGLLHDAGRLVLHRLFPAPMKEVAAAMAGGASRDHAEDAVFGVRHAEIGACVCERWNLPASISQAARHHHSSHEDLERAQVPREAILVSALCRLARNAGELDAGCALLQAPRDRVQQACAEAEKLAREGLAELAP